MSGRPSIKTLTPAFKGDVSARKIYNADNQSNATPDTDANEQGSVTTLPLKGGPSTLKETLDFLDKAIPNQAPQYGKGPPIVVERVSGEFPLIEDTSSEKTVKASQTQRARNHEEHWTQKPE
jgi:hypothetical protein